MKHTLRIIGTIILIFVSLSFCKERNKVYVNGSTKREIYPIVFNSIRFTSGVIDTSKIDKKLFQFYYINKSCIAIRPITNNLRMLNIYLIYDNNKVKSYSFAILKYQNIPIPVIKLCEKPGLDGVGCLKLSGKLFIHARHLPHLNDSILKYTVESYDVTLIHKGEVVYHFRHNLNIESSLLGVYQKMKTNDELRLSNITIKDVFGSKHLIKSMSFIYR